MSGATNECIIFCVPMYPLSTPIQPVDSEPNVRVGRKKDQKHGTGDCIVIMSVKLRIKSSVKKWVFGAGRQASSIGFYDCDSRCSRRRDYTLRLRRAHGSLRKWVLVRRTKADRRKKNHKLENATIYSQLKRSSPRADRARMAYVPNKFMQ